MSSWAREVSEPWGENSVRCAVLSLLKHHSQSTLAKLSPLSQSTISTIANGRYKNRLSLEKCREFGQWYTGYLQTSDYCSTALTVSPPDSRMTFHPDHEIPLLRRWYQDCPNPSSDNFASFAYELNRGHVRQDRPKVTAQKVKVWWKNERQRERRLQTAAERKPDVGDEPGASSRAGGEEGKGKGRKRSRSRGGSGSEPGSRPRGDVGFVREEEEGEGEEVVILDCEDEGEVRRPRGSPSAWGRKAEKAGQGQGQSQGHGHGHGQRSAFSLSAPAHPLAPPYSKPPPPHKSSEAGKHLQAPLGADPTFTVTAGTDPPGHTLLPGSGPHAPASWQSHFLSWPGMQRGRSPETRDAGVSPESSGLLPAPGWQQPRFQLLRGSGSGSRSEGERGEVRAGEGEGAVGERYRYTPSMEISPYPSSSSGSMDFSNIL